jgi:hypothetical protein
MASQRRLGVFEGSETPKMPLIEGHIKIGDHWRQTDHRQGHPNLTVGHRREEESRETECRALGVERRGKFRSMDRVAWMAASGLRVRIG